MIVINMYYQSSFPVTTSSWSFSPRILFGILVLLFIGLFIYFTFSTPIFISTPTASGTGISSAFSYSMDSTSPAQLLTSTGPIYNLVMSDDLGNLTNSSIKLDSQNNIEFAGLTTIVGDGSISGPNGETRISKNGIIFGGLNKDKENSSCQISAGLQDKDALCIVGMGDSEKNRKVKVLDILQLPEKWAIDTTDGNLRFMYDGVEKGVIQKDGKIKSATDGFMSDYVKYGQTIGIWSNITNRNVIEDGSSNRIIAWGDSSGGRDKFTINRK